MPYQRFIFDPKLKFPESLAAKMKELDEVAHALIRKSKKFGKTYIVTNAAEGWVELSAKRFMPKTLTELKGVQVISARTKFDKLYPGQYQKWKVEAFLETKRDFDNDAITNLVALGDNMFEIEAAHILGSKFSSSFIKTVKFRTSPSPNELIKQLNLVTVQLEYIMNTPKNLTVRLLKQKADKPTTLADGECDEATLASAQMMQAY
jgi:hypothetical protein